MPRLGQSAVHNLRHLIGLDHAATQLTSAERDCLSHHAAGRKRLLEIGVYEGASTRLLTEAAGPGADLYAVDPFLKGRLGFCWAKGIATREIRMALRHRQDVDVHIIEKFSHEAIGDVAGKLDFVFIDGDHSLEGIRRDWTDWSVRVVHEGIAALHDTKVPSHNPGVAGLGSFAYFERHIRHDPRFEIVEQVDSLTILKCVASPQEPSQLEPASVVG